MYPMALPSRTRSRFKRPQFTYIDLTTDSGLPIVDGVDPGFPDEVWELIFKQIDDPVDVLHVVQSCRRFYRVGLRPLYSSIQYSKPYLFQQNWKTWKDTSNAPVRNTTSSITITGVVDELYTMAQDRQESRVLNQYGPGRRFWPGITYQTDKAKSCPVWCFMHTTLLLEHLFRFTNLTTLAFVGIWLPYEANYAPRLLRNLTKLSFIDCIFESPSTSLRGQAIPTYALLLPDTKIPRLPLPPLIELIVWGNRGWEDILDRFRFQTPQDPPRQTGRLMSALDFMHAPTLRILRMDWDSSVIRIVFKALDPNQPNVDPRFKDILTEPSINPFMTSVPSTLQYLQIKYESSRSSRGQMNENHREDRAAMAVLGAFLARCPQLKGLGIFRGNRFGWARELDVGFQMTGNVNLLPNNFGAPIPVPPLLRSSASHLREFSGPIHLLPLLGGPANQIEALEIECPRYLPSSFRDRDQHQSPEATVDGFVKFFDKLEFPSLRVLSVVLEEVDVELFYLLAEKYRNLEVVKIRCWNQASVGLDDSTLLSLGAQFLSIMPRLEVFHLYSLKLTQGPINEDDNIVQHHVHYPDSEDDEIGFFHNPRLPRFLRQPNGRPDAVAGVQQRSDPISKPPPDQVPAIRVQRGYLAAWRRFCPQLKEIRLSSGVVWKCISSVRAIERMKQRTEEGSEEQDVWAIVRVPESCWEYEARWSLSGRLGVDPSSNSGLRGEGDLVAKAEYDKKLRDKKLQNTVGRLVSPVRVLQRRFTNSVSLIA
ncbi:hypothetical protein VKT23_007824 [Stygiomarasmius scandens]|uniref:F-box domain-containing protein n=1 Tax=Marasmiellus scandens TaxID=2682957 RepID=A0ABR1JL08_9AGAR